MLNGVEQKSAETSLRPVKRAVVADAGIMAVVFAVCKYFVVASEAQRAHTWQGTSVSSPTRLIQ